MSERDCYCDEDICLCTKSKPTLSELLAECKGENPHPDLLCCSCVKIPEYRIGFKRLSDEAIIPTKANPTDSGFDLYASEDVIIEPGETAIVPTGIAVELPPGYEATVRPRSGITAKTKLRVQLGTIDNGYKGEIGVIVDNVFQRFPSSVEIIKTIENNRIGTREALGATVSFRKGTYLIRKGDKLAQLVVQPLPAVEAYEVEGDLKETARGEGGFGSSGV